MVKLVRCELKSRAKSSNLIRQQSMKKRGLNFNRSSVSILLCLVINLDQPVSGKRAEISNPRAKLSLTENSLKRQRLMKEKIKLRQVRVIRKKEMD